MLLQITTNSAISLTLQDFLWVFAAIIIYTIVIFKFIWNLYRDGKEMEKQLNGKGGIYDVLYAKADKDDLNCLESDFKTAVSEIHSDIKRWNDKLDKKFDDLMKILLGK